MATYRITAPDGNEYDIDAPDDATEDQVLSFAQANYQNAGSPRTAAPKPSAEPVDALAAYDRGVASTGAPALPAQSPPATAPRAAAPGGGAKRAAQLYGVRAPAQGALSLLDAIAGGAQFAASALPVPGVSQINPMSPVGMRAIQSLLSGQAPDLSGVPLGAKEAGGRALSGLGVAEPQTPLERVGVAGVEGLTGAALTGGTGLLPALSGFTGGVAAQTAQEAGAGPTGQFVAGLAGALAPGGVRAATVGRAGPAANLRPVVETGQRIGVPVRPAGVSDSAVIETVRGAPLSGAKGRYERDVQRIAERAAADIGAPKGTPPQQTYAAAKARNSADFDEIAQRNAFTVDDSVLKKLANYRATAAQLGGAEAPAVKAIDEFLGQIQPLIRRPDVMSGLGGTPPPLKAQVPGALFKRLDTELGTVPYDKVSYNGLRDFMRSLRQQYKSTMDPKDVKQFDEVMTRYGNMKTLENLYAQAGQSGEAIDPGKIKSAAVRGRAGKSQSAEGRRGDLGELGDVAKRVRAPGAGGMKVTDLSTYLRILGTPLAPLAGMIVDAPALARYLTRPATQGKSVSGAVRGATGTEITRDKKDKK